MNIIAFEVEDWERQAFESLEGEHRIEFVAAPLTIENARDYAEAEVLCPFIYSDLSADVLQHFSRLRLIATRSTGFDHIDLGYCKEKDITVCNVPVYGDNTVAEHVFALLLAISHNMIAAVDRTRRGVLLEAGVKIYEYQPTMYHCKVMIVDGLWITLGSTNFDPRSFSLNDEANINYFDVDFATRQIEVFREDLANSREVTFQAWKDRPLAEKFWEHAATLLGSQL